VCLFEGTRACTHKFAMSALPPKADIAGRQFDVRFVPLRDIGYPIVANEQEFATECLIDAQPFLDLPQITYSGAMPY
jgi:hypothetical protein